VARAGRAHAEGQGERAGAADGPPDDAPDAADLHHPRDLAAAQRRGRGSRRVVAATVTRSRRRAAIVVALLAVGFIAAMALSGARPEGQWFVKFEATGLMRETPERIDRIELTATGRRLHFVRVGSGAWTVEGRPDLYLMPRFVGREWELVADATSRR